MGKHQKTINAKTLVLRALEQQGGSTQPQIAQHTQLTKNQVKTAIHDLLQSDEVYVSHTRYYPVSSKLSKLMTQRLWDNRLFLVY